MSFKRDTEDPSLFKQIQKRQVNELLTEGAHIFTISWVFVKYLYYRPLHRHPQQGVAEKCT